MAQYSRTEVFTTMQETGMVPLFYHSDVELGKKILKACYDGGARLMEFTARGDFAFEVFSELNKYALKQLPGSIYGPEFVKAIKGPQPWTSIMPTGGVSADEDNLKAWFSAGVTCVGMGYQLISKELLEKEILMV